MAQTPHKPSSKDDKDDKDDKHDLRDPAEGKSPAIGGGHVTTTIEERDRQRDPHAQRPTIGVKGEPIEDGERDPDTIAEEQRRRSDEMEAKGVNKWVEEHDERTPEQKAEARQVAGAQQPRIEGEHREHEAHERQEHRENHKAR